MQMWSVRIFMQTTDLIPTMHRTEYHIHHFHVRQKYEKRTCMDETISILLFCQYVVSYAYLRYANVFQRKKKTGLNSRARSGRSIPSEHAESAPGFASPLIAAYTFLDSLHTPALLCKQMFFLWCQLLQS